MTAAQNPLTPAPVALAAGSSNLDTPARVLAIGAHPDDIDFGCGATLAKWAADGCEVSVLVCTDGSKGTWDASADVTELIATRQAEQRAAARALGASGEVRFLGWPDGELDSSLEQREQVAKAIRELRPTIVLGHDPWKPYRLHPDHRHAGRLACEGVVAARDHLFFPEQGLAHHRPDLILLFETDNADHFEDVTGFEEAKYNALASHTSQFESTMLARAAGSEFEREMAQFRDKVEAKLAAAGAAAGVRHAEVYKLIDDL